MADNVHEGDLDLSDVTSPKGLELPDRVTGDLKTVGVTTVEGLKLPKHVGGKLDLSYVESLEEVTFPEHVGGDLHLWGLDEDDYDQEVHGPAELGGEVYFSKEDWL